MCAVKPLIVVICYSKNRKQIGVGDHSVHIDSCVKRAGKPEDRYFIIEYIWINNKYMELLFIREVQTKILISYYTIA